MKQPLLIDQVRVLRARRFTPTEIARALGIRKAEAARLVRVVAGERESGANDGPVTNDVSCWVNPGWRSGLSIEGDHGWPADPGGPAAASDSGVAAVLVAGPDRGGKLAVCGYLVDTWCLGVKNALGPRRVGRRELEAFRRLYFKPWESEGLAVPLGLAQHLVLGAVEYARGLGFAPHHDFRRARRVLGSWEGPSTTIAFGRDRKPHFVNGPDDDPQRVLATLERSVGRDGFHYTVSLDEFDELDDGGDGYRYSVSVSDLDALGEVA